MQTKTERAGPDRKLAAAALTGLGVLVALVMLLHPLKTRGV